VSGYWYQADRLITLTPDPSTYFGVKYVNEGRVRASGLELEAQVRTRGDVRGVISYALQRVSDDGTDEDLINSPRHVLTGRVSVHGPIDRSFISLEALYLSSRTTVSGQTLPPRALPM
jgi:outer membrane cobalamin receptor